MAVSLEGKSVLVVGASSGIGRATAVLFARKGAKVTASARRKERLEQLKQEFPNVEIFPADASDPAQMEKLAASVGTLDIMVFATGTNTPDRSMQRLRVDIWDMMISTNLNSAYYITRAVLPAMRERKAGHLMYVSSISGTTPDVSGASYQASKRGLLGLAHAIRVEEKENGIRTCVINPGLVESEILEKRPVKPAAELIAKALQPEDVAEMIVAVAELPTRAVVAELEIVPTYI